MRNACKAIVSGGVAAVLMLGWVCGAQAQAPGGAPGAGAPPPSGSMPPPDGQMGPPVASLDLKMSFPNKVEGLFDIRYANHQGLRPLTLDVYRVPEGSPKPAIVFIHGGGFMGGSNRGGSLPMSWPMPTLMAQIAARGYVVIAPNYRLSGEAKFPAQLEDAKAVVRWTRANAAKYGIDPQRVAIWGESVGGSIAALIGTSCGVADLEGKGGNANQSSCVQAVVDYYGVTDMAKLDGQAPPNATIIHNSPDSSQSNVLGCVLHYQCPSSVVQRANPIAYIDAADANVPFLIVHGDGDTAVSWKQSQILYDALRAKNVSAKLEIIPGLGHSFQGATPEQLNNILNNTFEFLGNALGASKK